jgi:hypothetical protein
MNMDREQRKDCYGAMFPETLHIESGQPIRGKVFACQLLTAGGTFRSDRRVTADREAWDRCVFCEDFEHCYWLSLGKLLLETAIAEK